MRFRSGRRSGIGFSLIELLVVVGIIAILAALLLPALSRGKVAAHRTVCLSHLKQLQIAWQSYADDFQDRLPPNLATSEMSTGNSWVLGNAKSDLSTSNLQSGVLFPYLRNPAVYLCPVDRAPAADSNLPRTRSYAMCDWINGEDSWVSVRVQRLSDLRRPGPVRTWIFAHEAEESIDNGSFGVFPPGSWMWVNWPTAHHAQAGTFGFADGHVESHRWRDNAVLKFVSYAYHVPAGDRDLQWLYDGLPKP